MKITVYGAGYVGLVTAVCFADLGYNVTCIDTNEDKINLLKQGKSPIYERGMDELLEKNIREKRLVFSSNVASGINDANFLFIAVGTPSAEDGSADLRYVYSVAHTIGQHLNNYVIVVDKSTVPVGTGDKVKSIINKELKKRGVSVDFDVVSNPEFLKQGDAIKDFMCSDRIIIGAESKFALDEMCNLYQPVKAKIITMDIRSAELSKYAANAFLATKISFINEIAQFAEKFGADVKSVREGIGTDSRIGLDFLHAGCGYGGSCFPKDVKALIWMAREYNMETPLFNAVESINMRQKHLIFNRLRKHFGDLENKVIALWGLAFKPNTDDMREAPSRVLIESLLREGAKIQAYDPVAMAIAELHYGNFPGLHFCKSADATLENADVLVIVTEWDQFRSFDLGELKRKLKNPLIFDGRNLFEPKKMQELGITYFGIGRKKQPQ